MATHVNPYASNTNLELMLVEDATMRDRLHASSSSTTTGVMAMTLLKMIIHKNGILSTKTTKTKEKIQ